MKIPAVRESASSLLRQTIRHTEFFDRVYIKRVIHVFYSQTPKQQVRFNLQTHSQVFPKWIYMQNVFSHPENEPNQLISNHGIGLFTLRCNCIPLEF